MLLHVRDLKTYFHTKEGPARAVDGVSFDIDAGETVALVGESGCGKSVTALSIIQLVPQPAGYHAGGTIEYQGQDIVRLPEAEKRKLRGSAISMIFQEPMTSLNPVLTVGFQLVEPLLYHQHLTRTEAQEKAIALLGQVNIPDPDQRFHEYPHQLSGGMKQRVMIAMAMACEPKLLIADEPTTALDVTIQAQILDLMKDLQQKKGTAILLITHDLGVVAETADRVAIMYAGRIVEMAAQERILANPAHPYTVKLLQSLPSGDQRERALQTIEGRVPAPHRFPPGCRFADRCHMVQAACRTVDPMLLPIEEGHTAACILYDERRQGRRITPEEVRMPPPPRPRIPGRDSPDTLIRIEGLKVYFPIRRGVLKKVVGHVKAVDGVDLTIRKGETLALVGESGCGKTTLGKALLQLIRPTAGRVLVDGQDLTTLDRQALHPYRRRLQVIFQDPYSALNQRMMVGEIVMEGMAAHSIGRTRKEREDRVKEILAQVGLDPDVIHRYPHEFSGGQRQRIGIARCLAVEPDFIVCDEATSALDVSVQAQILNLLEKLQTDLGLTYLFITHNLGVVEYLADEVAVMYLGRIVERGKTEEVFGNPRHPYTQALLSAIPKLDPATGIEKIRLSGDVPSPINPPTGCHFHPRCAYAMPLCREQYPPAYVLSDSHSSAGHTVWCHLYSDRSHLHEPTTSG
ncbi:MAG: dipeptide ABC transporter ATP-binding protein [Deltaproteobacteria bacterium]|nr:dipeptide ABC transporter ATP-binding protein [Deltaproteobacteria bacterium]